MAQKTNYQKAQALWGQLTPKQKDKLFAGTRTEQTAGRSTMADRKQQEATLGLKRKKAK